jgi:tetratricopeptide (TPR) repeat protein
MSLRRTLTAALCVALIAPPPWAAAATAAPPADPEIARGLKLVDDGDYDTAILTLDAAVRRLAGDASRTNELAQAYLYLGLAYVAKGQETAAKAKFREALKRAGDLSLSADRFPPKVLNIFEAARDEMAKGAPASVPTSKTTPAKDDKKDGKGGGKTALLVVGGLAAAGAVAAVALAGGGDDSGGGDQSSSFPNETVVFGGGREFVIDVKKSGTLTAHVDWQQDGVVLDMYIVNLNNAPQVLAEGGRTASRQTSLSLAVTPGSYRISVTNSTGFGPQVTTTFTLSVTVH